MAEATHAVGVQMLHHRPEGASLHAASEGLDDILKAFFAEGWNRGNPREVRARQRGMALNEVVTERDLFTPEELDREPWQTDFLDRFGLRWFASFSLRDLIEAAPFVMSVERFAADAPFSPDEVKIFAAAIPHFRRAVRLSISVGAAAQSGMMDALGALRQAGVLLDDQGAVVQVNEAAEALLGEELTVSRGRLRATPPSADAALQRLIGNVCWAGAAAMAPAVDSVALRRRRGRPLIVQASPLVDSARDIFQRARALVVINRLDALVEPKPEILRQAFNLTAAEVRVAHRIVAGAGSGMAAADLGVSPHTIRTHLKSLFVKTGTHSQSELAVLLSRVGSGLTL
jgi:DNA-binding CsgD family transcriptional regulator/PAS domain-containing protein